MGLNPAGYLDDQEPREGMGGLKLRLKFNLLKADGMLVWKSPELLSFGSTGDSVARWGLESSLLHEDIKRFVM